jgi:mono/diheme cytochrome c family protein
MPIWICLVATMALTEQARADDLPGEALAQAYCSACHRVSAEQAPPPKVTVNTGVGSEEYEAPSFHQIVARPGRDSAYLRTFIQAPHYPMREQVFISDELEQIVAYILSLKGSASAEW